MEREHALSRPAWNRNQVKALATFAMLVDHFAWAFLETGSVLGQICHFFGRLTGPVMAYLMAEGYRYTHSPKHYAMRLGIFAVLSWVPFVYFQYGVLPLFRSAEDCSDFALSLSQDLWFVPSFGVIYTLFLGFCAIWVWDKSKWPREVKLALMLLFCLLSIWGDWPVYDVLFCLIFYQYRDDKRTMWGCYAVLSALYIGTAMASAEVWWESLYTFGMVLAPCVLEGMYTHEPGSKRKFHKWFFYVFYPTHLILLGIARWAV